MHKMKRKTRRISVTLSACVYGHFHEFAESRSWSDSQAVAELIEMCLIIGVLKLTGLDVLTEKNIRKGNKRLGVG